MNIIDQLIYEAQNKEMIDSHYTESGKLMMNTATLLKEMYNEIYIIANDYVELSHEKINWQRNDYMKRCKKLLDRFHELDDDLIEPKEQPPLEDNF